MYIKGASCTKFGIGQKSIASMIYEAAYDALEDADIALNKIDIAIVSNMDILNNGERQRYCYALLSSLFNHKMPVINVTNACDGGGTALWTAVQLGNNKEYRNMLVLGFEKIAANTTKNVTDDIMMAAENLYEQHEGLNFPAQNALVAQQHMLRHGTTLDDFALVAFKNHNNAYLNPKARFYNKKVSLEEIKNSPVVASPLRLYDCSISVNGASACVLSKDRSNIKILASSHATDTLCLFERPDMASFLSTKNAAKQAFAQAKLKPGQIDVAELHDAFTSVELISYEDIGFAEPGKGADLMQNGVTELNGKLPVNTSGGLKAKGHPISATGLGQIYELVKQLRKEAGDRQVNAKYALAHNIGGAGCTASVHILGKV